MAELTNDQSLDKVLEEMVSVVESSKDEIVTIGDTTRTEYERLVVELEETKEQVQDHIDKGDTLEKQVRLSRQHLSTVSKHFDQYAESEIKAVYEKTYAQQTELAMLRQSEASLRNKRDDLERRLKRLYDTIDRAETLTSKISIILKYLNDDFQQVSNMIEDAKEKQEFGLKMIEAQEDERRKISREIHDGPAQMLANVMLRSEIVERTYREGKPSEVLSEIKDVRQMVRDSLYDVRRIIYDLRPMALDDLGLVPTVRKYVETIAEYNDIQIDLTTLGKEERLPSKYEVACFRLTQEALQNAIQHAKSTFIQVKLELNDHFMLIVIKDDGRGFNPEDNKDNSFGLISMRERVEMLSGTLNIDSKINQGTTIFIKIPL